jgi:hypothetical protein
MLVAPQPPLPRITIMHASRRSRRLQVESLEQRLLLHGCLFEFSTASFAGAEGGSVTVSVVRSRVGTPAATLDVQVAGGSAIADDFSGATRTLSWNNGELGTKSFSIALAADSQIEGTETIQLRLANNTAGSLGSATATVNITDTSPGAPVVPITPTATTTPSLRILDVRILEGQTTRTALFKVRLSARSESPVTVRYATASSTARAGSDFVSTSGTVTFRPGVVERTIAVRIRGDRLAERDERFFVNLTRPAGATLADRQAVGTLRNDDRTLTSHTDNDSAWLLPVMEALQRKRMIG